MTSVRLALRVVHYTRLDSRTKRGTMSVGDAPAVASSDLEGFFDYLYDTREGYVYAATKEHNDHHNLNGPNNLNGPPIIWKQHFFSWPSQRSDLLKFTLLNRARKDIYIAPAMFSKQEATKENVIGASVVWVELDEAPKALDNVPPPTCRISSGGDGHEHWYWKIDTVLNSDQLDLVNRALTYLLDADPSGWDSTQVLRPPETFNHKRKRETTQILMSDVVLDPSLFSSIPQPPPKADAVVPTYIPPVEEVIARYPFPKTVRDLFFNKEPRDRSDALMALGYHLAEMGLAKPEILSVILNADERWGKFKGRDDRMRRLMEIVSVAVTKYPSQSPKGAITVNLTPMGFKTLLATEIKLEWQWEGFLEKNGYYLLTGPTGVGKTQFSMDAAGHMALGKSFLDKPMRQARVGFFSLEMGLISLKHFLSQMQYSFTLAEQEILENNLQFFPLGEPLYMTNENVKAELEQIIGDLKLDGIMVDSLGSATDESVSDEAFKKFFHWNDTLRQRHNIFTWYIHHHRKASGDNRKPNKISDVYGSQYITSYATSVGCLWDVGVPNLITYIDLKKRLSPRSAPVILSRDERLHFVIAKPAQNSVLQAPAQGSPPGPAVPGLALGQPTDPRKPAAGHTAAVTGHWSSGPGSASDPLTPIEKNPKDEDKKVSDITVNLSFGGLK